MSVDPYDRLLGAWVERERTLGKSEALHPKTLERVMRKLDANGQREGADAIQSLVWMHQLMAMRGRFYLERLREAEGRRVHSHAAVGLNGD